MNENEKLRQRRARELAAVQSAKQSGKAKTYIDDDGCEVTALPAGHIFYNASDWW